MNEINIPDGYWMFVMNRPRSKILRIISAKNLKPQDVIQDTQPAFRLETF